MEPAYTTMQPENLHRVGPWAMDYNYNASPSQVDHLRPGTRGTAKQMMGLRGLDGFGAVDVRPYVTFYTSAGAIPVAIDPTSVLSGQVIFPVVGAIPYDLDIVSFAMVLHIPAYGDLSIPLSVTGGGSSTVNIPGLGDVPYEVSIGPPAGALVPGGVFSMSNLFSFAEGSILPLLFIGAAAYFLLKR
jgi:hypothetical protein